MTTVDQLKKLFQAFKEDNSLAFYTIARRIIEEEKAANHFGIANELVKALGVSVEEINKKIHSNNFSVLQKEKKDPSPLIQFKNYELSPYDVILEKETELKLTRVILEHKRRNDLLKFGYLPKTKLLFWGPPGCGKSLTAKYLGQELGIPVGHLNLSSIVSSLLGETSANLQRVFEIAKEKPCVLLIDEFDSLGKFRDDPNDVGELKRIVNSLLFIIDGWFSSNSILIAATNHSYLLDPALWRRFDEIVYFPLPEKTDRVIYLKRMLSGVKFNGSIESIGEKLSGLSFADIEKILRESVKTMILDGKKSISSKEILSIIFQFKKDYSTASSRTKG